MEYAERIDWTGAPVDIATVRARGGGQATGLSSVDRRKPGSKHFVAVDADGTPLAARTTAANRADVSELERAVDAIPPVRGKRGRPRRRGIVPRIARSGDAQGSGLGKVRWVVERTLSWLHDFGRLRVRKDRSVEIHQGFLDLASSIICYRQLPDTQLC